MCALLAPRRPRNSPRSPLSQKNVSDDGVMAPLGQRSVLIAVLIAVVGTAAPPLTTNDPPLTTNDVVMYIPTTLNHERYAHRVFKGSLKTWARVYESTPNRLFVISDDGAAARSRLSDHECASLDTPIVFEKHAETFRCSTTTVLLVDCVSAHWGGAGPCCKNEVALMHFARAFRDGLHPPRWMIFGEDDL